jgi:hypothetical protein
VLSSTVGCLDEELRRGCMRAAGAQVGVLVGRLAAGNKDVVMWCAPTPTDCPLAAPAEVEVEWTVEHARQCARMLPGGLAVVGLYVVAPLASYVHAPL